MNPVRAFKNSASSRPDESRTTPPRPPPDHGGVIACRSGRVGVGKVENGRVGERLALSHDRRGEGTGRQSGIADAERSGAGAGGGSRPGATATLTLDFRNLYFE